MIKVTNIPAGEQLSGDFSVWLNDEQVQLYQIRVSAMPFAHTFLGKERPLDQTELASLLSFGADEPVRVVLKPRKQFEKVTIRPLSEKVCPKIENGIISFTLNHPGQYVVELDGPHNALHIFVDPLRDFGILADSENTLYFGPGVHHPGQITLTDNMTVYIDRDAVVYGAFLAYGSKNIRMLGNGILCGSWYERQANDLLQAYDVGREAKKCYESPKQRAAFLARMEPIKSSFCDPETYIPGTGTFIYQNREQFGKLLEVAQPIKAGLHFYACQNIEVNGIILRDVCGMTNTIIACDYVVYDNFKTIGMWRYNSDGINFYNSRNCMVKNCFVRAYDDGICMKGKPGYDTRNTENILVENCVVWNDWGHSLEFGVNTVAPEIHHITYKDIDIIHHASAIMDIGNEDRADIHDVLFEDIRVEYSVHDVKSILQKSEEQVFEPQRGINVLIRAVVDCEKWSCDNIPGRNHHITFRNIAVFTEDDMPFPPIVLMGKDAEHTSTDFVFENFTLNGKRLQTKEELHLELNEFVRPTDVTIR